MMKLYSIFLLTLVTFSTAHAQSSERLSTIKETCSVVGTVIKTEQWLYAPYQQTPSMFSDVYTKLTVKIQSADTFEAYMKDSSTFCEGLKDDAEYTYKLCAPVRPQLGDVVRGVVAPPVGLTQDGCLFDIQVLDNVKNTSSNGQ